MEFIDASSSPATVSELDLFKVPPTQTVIESMYDIEYRPIGSINRATNFEFVIPASEHYTDLSASYIYAKLNVVTSPPTAKVIPTDNYASSLFEQLDVHLGNVNITPGNSLYHYQSFIDDLFFKYKSPMDACQMIDDEKENNINRIKDKKIFDIIIPIHAPMFQQEKYLIDGIPITLRFKCAPSSFGLQTDEKDAILSVEFNQISIFIRRVKVYPPVQMSITQSLQRSPVKYFFQRNDMKSFHLPNGFAANSIDNIYTGQLPKKIIVGFVSDKALNGDLKTDPFIFKHKNLQSIALVVNGMKIPHSPYKPDFNSNLFMREYYNLFRSLNQDFGVPQIDIKYADYSSKYPLLVFDLSDDGTLTSESGALSLVKRGNARMDLQFSTPLDEGMHMIIYGIFDSLLQIDASRNISVDY